MLVCSSYGAVETLLIADETLRKGGNKDINKFLMDKTN
jgi:stalled ribosome rescue protein Dom34